MDENRPARHLGAENPNILPHGHDYEYDEAHDVPAGPLGRTPATHRVTPLSKVNLGADGDYGYDEATISAPPEQPTPDIAYISGLGPPAH